MLTNESKSNLFWRQRGYVVAAGVGVALAFLARAIVNPTNASAVLSPDNAQTKPSPARGSLGQKKRCLPPPLIMDVAGEEETDPTNSKYDPVKLRDRGVSGADIFLREPRNQPWASGMELSAGKLLVDDISAMIPEAGPVDFECRTSMCRISWLTNTEEIGKKVRAAVMLVRISPRLDRTETKENRSSFLIFYRPVGNYPEDQPELARDYDVSDPKRFGSLFRQRRAKVYQDARDGKQNLLHGLAKERVPR